MMMGSCGRRKTPRDRPAETVVAGEVDSPNLLLLMEYRGRKRAIPLLLSNETVSMLALEAPVREMSVGELVGTILGAAVERGVPRLLDADAGKQGGISFQGSRAKPGRARNQRHSWAITHIGHCQLFLSYYLYRCS
jgi:hypothetical protein